MLTGSILKSANVWLIILILSICTILFAIDISLPLGIAGGTLYIIPIFISLNFNTRKAPVFVAGVCTVLTVLGYFISPPGVAEWIVITNRMMSGMAIIFTTILGIRLQTTQMEAQKVANLPKENPNPIMRISYTCELRYANQSALKIIADKSENQNPYTLPKDWTKAIEDVLTTGKIVEVEFENKKTVFSLKFTPVPNADYVNVYGMDITDRKHQELILQRLSNSDELTGISNRRKFNKSIVSEWKRAKRFNNMLSLILIDIDYFKNYNDTYGHQSGDHTIIKVARALEKFCNRPADLVARYGGEEFVILLPETDINGACSLAEKILKAVEALNIPHKKSTVAKHVTISAGVASARPTIDLDYKELIYTADKALYKAKAKGRNNVCFYKKLQKIS